MTSTTRSAKKGGKVGKKAGPVETGGTAVGGRNEEDRGQKVGTVAEMPNKASKRKKTSSGSPLARSKEKKAKKAKQLSRRKSDAAKEVVGAVDDGANPSKEVGAPKDMMVDDPPVEKEVADGDDRGNKGG